MNAPTEASQLQPQQREAILAALRAVLPAACLLSEQEDTRPYECDGLTAYRQLPMAVALPQNEAQLIAVLKVCRQLQVPIVPRGGVKLPHTRGL